MSGNTGARILLIASMVALGATGLRAQAASGPFSANVDESATGRRTALNALAGSALGAVAGSAFGATASASCCVPVGWSRGEATALWAGAGAGAGLVIGVVVGQLGREPYPVWKSALAGGAIGAAGGATGGLLGGADGSMTANYTAFGAGTGALVGALVGVLADKRDPSASASRWEPTVRPTAAGLQLGWRAPLGR